MTETTDSIIPDEAIKAANARRKESSREEIVARIPSAEDLDRIAVTRGRKDHDFAEQLREETIAVRLRKTHLGMTKRLTAEQSQRQADLFRASTEVLSGSKRLFRRRSEHLKAINSVLTHASQYVKDVTVAYPLEAVRLLRRDRLDEFNQQMNKFLDELADALVAAEEVYTTEILPDAKYLLGDLPDSSDYPATLTGQWSLDWDFPSVQPDERLAKLNPQLYEQEKARVAKQFEEAIRLQEQAFVARLQEVVSSLVDRLKPKDVRVYRYNGPSETEIDERQEEVKSQIEALTNAEPPKNDSDMSSEEWKKEIDEYSIQIGNEIEERESDLGRLERQRWIAAAESIECAGDRITIETTAEGKTKCKHLPQDDPAAYLVGHDCEFVRIRQELKSFKSTTVTHLNTFFEQFGQLNIGSNDDLDRLVDDAKLAVNGIDVKDLRETEQDGRDVLRVPLEEIGARLEALMVDKPSRSISLVDE